MRINQKMSAILGHASLIDFCNAAKLSEKLLQIVAKGFTTFDGAVVFTAMSTIAENVRPESFQDLTGFECFVNQVHIEDHVHSSLDQIDLLKQGIAFTLATQNQLYSSFPDKPFTIIVTKNERTCGVRFHVTRLGEEWLATNLDGYGQEAILALGD